MRNKKEPYLPEKRICKICKAEFDPDKHNRSHQKTCGSEECKRINKKKYNKKWRKKNPDYFKLKDDSKELKKNESKRVMIWKEKNKIKITQYMKKYMSNVRKMENEIC